MSALPSRAKPQAALPVFFTRAEAAAVLRRSAKSLDRLMAADATFPRTRLPGDGVLVPIAALEAWLRARTEGMRGPLRLAEIARTSETPATHALAGALTGR